MSLAFVQNQLPETLPWRNRGKSSFPWESLHRTVKCSAGVVESVGFILVRRWFQAPEVLLDCDLYSRACRRHARPFPTRQRCCQRDAHHWRVLAARRQWVRVMFGSPPHCRAVHRTLSKIAGPIPALFHTRCKSLSCDGRCGAGVSAVGWPDGYGRARPACPVGG